MRQPRTAQTYYCAIVWPRRIVSAHVKPAWSRKFRALTSLMMQCMTKVTGMGIVPDQALICHAAPAMLYTAMAIPLNSYGLLSRSWCSSCCGVSNAVLPMRALNAAGQQRAHVQAATVQRGTCNHGLQLHSLKTKTSLQNKYAYTDSHCQAVYWSSFACTYDSVGSYFDTVHICRN